MTLWQILPGSPTGVLAVVCALLVTVRAHPQCLDFMPPFEPAEPLTFCREYGEFGCCTRRQDYELQRQFDDILRRMPYHLQTSCHHHLMNILCQECSPYASHLYDLETTQVKKPLPGMCPQYCPTVFNSCKDIIPFITGDPTVQHAISLSNYTQFCEVTSITDMDYCYPNLLANEQLSGNIQQAVEGTGGEGCLCFQEFANGLKNPTVLVHAGDGTHRVFIGEQLGKVYVYLPDGSRVDTPFLDLTSTVLTSSRRGDERGFLGMAFHPDFKENKRLFVYYSVGTPKNQKIRISEFKVASQDVNQVDQDSEKVILELDEPAANHNGGQLLFGVDGFMYAFIGDGGKGGDPFGEKGNALNMTTLLGKIIRIDVNHPDESVPYGVPWDNPFVGQRNVKPEIYAYGTRNMWRCAVDRGDPESGEGRGRIFCGDVGQGKWEEIDIIEKGGNYGWRAFEGFECFDKELCETEELANHIPPIHVYGHDVGKSVTGGYVYRGCLYPNLNGQYIYGDFWNGKLFSLTEDKERGVWNNREICAGSAAICNNELQGSYVPDILSFGEDEAGEMYMLSTDYASTSHTGGIVYRIVDPARRGDPEQCSRQISPVTVHGSTTPFVHSSERVTCRTCRRAKANSNTYCNADFVLRGSVMERRTVKNGFLTEVYVQISVHKIWKQSSAIPKIKSSLRLWLSQRTAQCDCPKVQVGSTYFIMGIYDIWSKRLKIHTTTVVRLWHYNWSKRVLNYKMLCDFRSRPTIKPGKPQKQPQPLQQAPAASALQQAAVFQSNVAEMAPIPPDAEMASQPSQPAPPPWKPDQPLPSNLNPAGYFPSHIPSQDPFALQPHQTVEQWQVQHPVNPPAAAVPSPRHVAEPAPVWPSHPALPPSHQTPPSHHYQQPNPLQQFPPQPYHQPSVADTHQPQHQYPPYAIPSNPQSSVSGPYLPQPAQYPPFDAPSNQNPHAGNPYGPQLPHYPPYAVPSGQQRPDSGLYYPQPAPYAVPSHQQAYESSPYDQQQHQYPHLSSPQQPPAYGPYNPQPPQYSPYAVPRHQQPDTLSQYHPQQAQYPPHTLPSYQQPPVAVYQPQPAPNYQPYQPSVQSQYPQQQPQGNSDPPDPPQYPFPGHPYSPPAQPYPPYQQPYPPSPHDSYGPAPSASVQDPVRIVDGKVPDHIKWDP
ncbi:PREDICTED: HHIP-like protein 2 isoform X1 [Branchiostoma belcheri]|uniref:HHIP-like protein 2 isoform X1 n=2 Tax=Branchiostoma belcheri TaxID=7741 RepID=A0A6P4Y8U6_BRABE|nr:PREDICTED: HHIP-like protein 2 isoform X1 [Branchiostoma belcheri]